MGLPTHFGRSEGVKKHYEKAKARNCNAHIVNGNFMAYWRRAAEYLILRSWLDNYGIITAFFTFCCVCSAKTKNKNCASCSYGFQLV